jgi:hypothetical protein
LILPKDVQLHSSIALLRGRASEGGPISMRRTASRHHQQLETSMVSQSKPIGRLGAGDVGG